MKRLIITLLLISIFSNKADIFDEEITQQDVRQNFIVISLGGDCSPSFHARRHGIRTAAYPFDWCLTPYVAVIDCINQSFAHFFQKENLIPSARSFYREELIALIQAKNYDIYIEKNTTPSWILDKKLGIIFNHDFTNRQPETIATEYQANYEKYQRRINRFYQAINSEKHIYFIRHQCITKTESIQLYQHLKSAFPSTIFTLIVIADDPVFKDDWHIEGIKNFYNSDNGITSQIDPFWENLCKQIETGHLIRDEKLKKRDCL